MRRSGGVMWGLGSGGISGRGSWLNFFYKNISGENKFVPITIEQRERSTFKNTLTSPVVYLNNSPVSSPQSKAANAFHLTQAVDDKSKMQQRIEVDRGDKINNVKELNFVKQHGAAGIARRAHTHYVEP